MRSRNLLLRLFISVAALSISAFVLRAQDGPKPAPTVDIFAGYAVTDYFAVENKRVSVSDKRFQANLRYDKEDWVLRNINNPETSGVGRITEEQPPPLFPVNESSLVLVGKVIDRQAFLSNDKTGIYTEFTIQVDDLIKRGNDSQLNIHTIIADRPGGAVRYPDGKKVAYGDENQLLPEVGIKYLIFLTRPDLSPNYKIYVIYEVTDSAVRQVDPRRIFSEYKNLKPEEFIELVRKKVASP